MPPLVDLGFYYRGEEICTLRAQCRDNRNVLCIKKGRRCLRENDAILGLTWVIQKERAYSGCIVFSLVTKEWKIDPQAPRRCLLCNSGVVLKCLAARGCNNLETSWKYLARCRVRKTARNPECHFFVVLLRELLATHLSSSFPSIQAERVTAFNSLLLPL